MQILYFFYDLVKLGLFILVYFIDGVLPDHRLVGGNNYHFQLINLVEFLCLGDCGTGHP